MENAIVEKKDISNMIKRDIDETFFSLGLAYKSEPTYITMHNFGTLLSKYGHEISFVSENYIEIARKLLLSAKEQNESFITLKELADLFLNQKSYPSAVLFYNDALKYTKSYSVCYNLALSYYYLQDFSQMKVHLDNSLHNLECSNCEIVSLYELFGFSCALTGDKRRARSVLKYLQNNPNYLKTPETLKLAYLCEEYSFIVQNYETVYNEWIAETIDCKIVSQAFQNAKIESMENFRKFFYESIMKFYIENPNIEIEIEELLSTINSNTDALNITLTLAPMFSCDFY